MTPYKTRAHINSLGGAMDEITILQECEHPKNGKYYIVDYRGVKCTAIFNWFTCEFYADDKYGRI